MSKYLQEETKRSHFNSIHDRHPEIENNITECKTSASALGKQVLGASESEEEEEEYGSKQNKDELLEEPSALKSKPTDALVPSPTSPFGV